MNSYFFEKFLSIGKIKLKNRIVFPPITTNWANKKGFVTKNIKKHYQAIANGGCGMIVVEGTTVSPEGKSVPRALCIYDESYLPGLETLSRIIHKQGSFASLQIAHAGGQANPEFTGYEPFSPSAMGKGITGTGYSSREMSLDEIEKIKNHFVESALLVARAGFDAAEIHLAHGYLLHEFLSPHTNKRGDSYGGNLENRIRLPLDIIHEIKKQNPNFLLGARISGEDYVEDGINEKANREILPLLESAGINYFSVTAGIYETSKLKHKAMKNGKFFEYSHEIRNIVKKPVIGVGKILDLDSAEKHLKNFDCDLVAIGRGLIADPEMINKIKQGKSFNKCIECDACSYLRFNKPNLTCPVRGEDV